ncbi:MAG TPA: sigma-70 family RNA polymerase sigma factor [Thermoanaerobaculia bacterium]
MDEFERFYLDTAPDLRAFAMRRGLALEDAEDILQEAFLVLHNAQIPFAEARQFLFGVAGNLVAAHWRAEEWIDREAVIPERTRTPRYEGALDAQRFLQKLPRLQRRVFSMHRNGFTVAQIASKIRRKKTWTETLLRRARKAAAKAADITNRRRVGRRVRRTDTYDCRRMICAHVRPVRGPAVPRAPARAAVFPLHRVPAGEVRRQFSRARGMVPPSRRAA